MKKRKHMKMHPKSITPVNAPVEDLAAEYIEETTGPADKDKNPIISSLMQWSTIVGLALTAAFLIYGFHAGIFSSREALEKFLQPFGIWAPLLFIVIQIVQVVVPIIPGGVSCLAGVLLFGPWWGFVYNYVGICIGSIWAFLLSKHYGQRFVRSVASDKLWNRYSDWVNRGKTFERLFAAAIFFPVAPDDFLCYLAGLTKMTTKKFSAIILLGKPASIALYSMGLDVIRRGIMAALASA